MSQKFTILGGGRWGTALASHLSRLGHEVLVYDKNPKVVESLNAGVNPYLESQSLERIASTQDLKEAIDFSQYLVVALPVQAIRSVLEKAEVRGKVIISASKGLEIGTHKRVSQIIEELSQDCQIFCLSGPSFAVEVMKGLPTAVVLAGQDMEQAQRLRELISSPYFRVYLCDDIVGVELGGALKNVIAIACGISDGLGYGHNARAALMTRGLAEMVRIGVQLGAKRDTFYGLSGMGDLFLTASSDLSRNRTFGYLIGQGLSAERALERIGQVVEGYHTVKAVKELSDNLQIYAPISQALYSLLFEGKPLEEVLKDLLLRPSLSPYESL
ncbi:NAD(P)H-dependent glycerol-3-phosphate dehydrogenase [Thermocrinis minervae]|uniref:Glycerol-3-phosphate dehydrogenase [NAD(P)+] n=1 Tax=Thermocrinis minervae TaxID=381751 RepID=A0A1M6S7N6_9AQUI|nr:NAD(P)H-dependent glycerol-3-phosphate dehydrogenase [Thermocrinis minervae]SHK40548.1 glycerol 3-phosphate dehydrogenase (NAD(P)+) [Thermocrinis minervae]